LDLAQNNNLGEKEQQQKLSTEKGKHLGRIKFC
jgi:hypothetical protein